MDSIDEIIPGRVTCLRGFLDADEAAGAMDTLLRETPFEEGHLRFFGKPVPMPRLVAWYGDEGAVYRYSGIVNLPLPWTPRLADLRARIESAPAIRERAPKGFEGGRLFNSVLLNYYRTNRDSVGLHADDEPELGRNPFIASLSLGAARTFLLKWRSKSHGADVRIVLEPGSLLVMWGDCQHVLRHALPKSEREMGPRINLTFRRVVNRSD